MKTWLIYIFYNISIHILLKGTYFLIYLQFVITKVFFIFNNTRIKKLIFTIFKKNQKQKKYFQKKMQFIYINEFLLFCFLDSLKCDFKRQFPNILVYRKYQKKLFYWALDFLNVLIRNNLNQYYYFICKQNKWSMRNPCPFKLFWIQSLSKVEYI